MRNLALKLLFIALISITSTSCKSRVVDVKSPCVSLEDGPCGVKKPINDWWLKDMKNTQI